MTWKHGVYVVKTEGPGWVKTSVDKIAYPGLVTKSSAKNFT